MDLHFLAALPLISRIFLIAFIVPVIHWCLPARWRTGFLLGVSILTLLYGGVTIVYLAMLTVLIFLVWSVTAPAPPETEESKPLSPWLLWPGLAAIALFALALALDQRILTPTPVDELQVLSATLAAVSILGLVLIRQKDLRRGVVQRFLPVVVIVGLNLVLTPHFDLLLVRFEAVPVLGMLLVVTTLMCCVLCVIWSARASNEQRRQIAGVGIVLLIILFIAFKWPVQDTILAWFGFSYIAFRLLHVLLERRQNTPLPTATPTTWSLYALFFSAQAVGPIDRWPRFAADHEAEKRFSWEDFVSGWERILWGAIKKFFIADVLLRALVPGQIAAVYTTPIYAWVQLYAYAFYLYCDFSGIVDIAIGTARLVGFHLPENFDRPYMQGSIAQFWQSWHITLSSWLRTYVFLPLTRSLLRTRMRRYSMLIVLVANLVTMSLIGLWHGFTLNFLAWGIWHALGLFIHKIFSDRTRRMQLRWKNTWKARAFHVFSVLLTFHFVVVGWAFFALPTLAESLYYLLLLLGTRLS